MKNLFLSIFFLSLTLLSLAQESKNMQFLSNWNDPTIPSRSGTTYNDVWGFAYRGREYAILGSVAYTHFIDVTDPQKPFEVGRILGGYPNSIWRDFKTYKTWAYGVADQTGSNDHSGLQIFDLSQMQDKVTKVYDSRSVFEKAHNLFIDETYGRLYVLGSNTRSDGVIVMDLTKDPQNPTVLASVPLAGGYVHDVYVRDNIAYCSHGYNGLFIYDMTDPANPIMLGQITGFSNQGYNHSSWLTEDGAFMVYANENHGQPLRVLDVSDFNNMSLVSTFRSALLVPTHTNSIPHNPMIKGDLVFVSYYHDGVQVFDISDVTSPKQVAWYDTYPKHANYNGYRGVWGIYPFLPSGTILGSDQRTGLYMLKLDIPITEFTGKMATAESSPKSFSHNSGNLTSGSQGSTLADETFSAHLYPNPVATGSTLSLDISSMLSGNANISITDLTGRKIHQEKFSTTSGKQSIRIQTHTLSPGIYFLDIEANNTILRKKFILVEN